MYYKNCQRGFAHVLVLILLFVGLIAGVYLVQKGTSLFSKAVPALPSNPETSFELELEKVSTIPFPDEPAPQWVNPGSKFRVDIYVRSDTDTANLFAAKLKFPVDLLEVIEVNGREEASFVKVWADKKFDNTVGTVNVVGGVTDPKVKTDSKSVALLLGSVIFKAKKVGSAKIEFADSSAIYRDLDNVNILTIKKGLTIAIDDKVVGDASGAPSSALSCKAISSTNAIIGQDQSGRRAFVIGSGRPLSLKADYSPANAQVKWTVKEGTVTPNRTDFSQVLISLPSNTTQSDKSYEIASQIQLNNVIIPCQVVVAVVQPVIPDTASFEVGIEAGAQSDTGKVNTVAKNGAVWVRLNFIGSNWTEGSSDVAKYNAIIDAYTEKGVKILGLIGAESVAGGYDKSNPGGFTQKYVDTADAIIARFGDRVTTYELFNEPNDWAGGNGPQMPADIFARNLAKIYQQIKIVEDRQEITLISGPLFSADITTAADYLQETFSAGKTSEGWEDIKASTGSYPLDGVGYHLYVAQGMGDQGVIESGIQRNINAIKGVLADNGLSEKIWISEIGWGTGKDRVTEEVQATNLKKAFEILKKDSSVRMALWFTLQDFDETEWGLLRGDGKAKLAMAAFRDIAKGPEVERGCERVATPGIDVQTNECHEFPDVCNGLPRGFNALKSYRSCIDIGDINGDNKKDLADLSGLFTNWGKIVQTKADLNGDSMINSFDFSLLRNILVKNKAI